MNQLFLVLLFASNLAVLIMAILLLARSSSRQDYVRMEKAIKEASGEHRQEVSSSAQQLRAELSQQLKNFSDTLLQLTRLNEDKLNSLGRTVEGQLRTLQEDNSKKLEQMRQTVDEKLHSTLEKRLGESFKLVSVQLEQVHKGLGEMQALATGVGDLKKVLANVKTRGAWGEVQLGNLLDQILTIDQYAKNVAVKKGSRERVEFAIKLPGHDHGTVWLPLDAKFPTEDYQKLLEAQDKAQLNTIEELGKALESRIKSQAKDIRDKYIDPPQTTDFAILFLPVEGLYAEVLRRPGLWEFLQREYRVIVTGPTTIAALLNSLQMGFRTLAIEKRASEVWMILGAVKTEFSKFGEMLEKTHKKLQEASNTIDEAAKKTRTIEQKLKHVQQLPSSEIPPMLKQDGNAETNE